jgi:hypothetical protein
MRLINDLGWRNVQNEDVDLEKLNNFVVDNFFIWSHLVRKSMFEFLKFEIWIYKWPQMEKQPIQKL